MKVRQWIVLGTVGVLVLCAGVCLLLPLSPHRQKFVLAVMIIAFFVQQCFQ